MNRKLRIGLRIVAWLFVLAWLIYGISYAKRSYKKKICTRLEVRVLDSAQYFFVRANDVKKAILSSSYSPLGKPLHSINTYKIEEKILTRAAVRTAEAYKLHKGVLRVDITQRKPVLRVFNAKRQSYYIDDAGKILPNYPGFAAEVLVASGNISEPFAITNNAIDLNKYSDSPIGSSGRLLYDLYQFAKYINNDEFWNAQIEQVYVRKTNSVELIPLVGPHVVELGGLNNFEGKLKKLKLFYRKALPVEGWNQYSMINLKYSNQIVCTKF